MQMVSMLSDVETEIFNSCYSAVGLEMPGFDWKHYGWAKCKNHFLPELRLVPIDDCWLYSTLVE
jgi:hypothetical protein